MAAAEVKTRTVENLKASKAAAEEERRLAKGPGHNTRGSGRGGRVQFVSKEVVVIGVCDGVWTAQLFPLNKVLHENIQELTKEHSQTLILKPQQIRN